MTTFETTGAIAVCNKIGLDSEMATVEVTSWTADECGPEERTKVAELTGGTAAAAVVAGGVGATTVEGAENC